MRNPTCRHILFGACHDNGYVRMLEDFAEDDAIVERVTLLYSFSIGKEFKRLRFKSTTMDTIFRTTLPGVPTTATTVKHQGAPGTENAHPIIPKTWATLAISNQRVGEGLVPIKTNSTAARTVSVNAVGHRVDEQLPRPSKAAMNSWNHRVKVVKMRYCRMYHLNGSCQGGCGYSHGPLSDEEKLVYRRNLREEVCHTGLKCRDISCHYGHNCSCKNTRCKFSREMHDVDETTAEVWER